MKDERARLSKVVRPLTLLDWRHGPPSRFGRSVTPIGRSRRRDGIKVELRAHPTLLHSFVGDNCWSRRQGKEWDCLTQASPNPRNAMLRTRRVFVKGQLGPGSLLSGYADIR